ncbi:hypothetical protein [Coraliomargarita parva]|uniref:hypothetical protein n=1 Tax=Coraliomargarita parva TaxID=3014050 RepID=UPI0022B437B8|nr:hypothetical protein [Coraliomargarita parva]
MKQSLHSSALLGVLCAAFLASSLCAETATKSAEALCRDLIQSLNLREPQASGNQDSPPALRRPAAISSLRTELEQRVLPDILKEEWNQPRLVLQRQLSNLNDAEFRDAVQALLDKVLEEKQAQKDRLIERFKAFEAQVAAGLMDYTEADELDGPIQKVNLLEQAIARVPYWDSGERPDSSRMRDLLMNWQEYLYYRSRGDIAEVKNRLKRLENLLGRYPLIARSQILALRERAGPDQLENEIFKALDTCLAEMDGPESYPQVLDALQQLYKQSERNHKVSSYLSVTKAFVEARQAIEAKNPEAAFSKLNGTRHAAGYGNDPVLVRERSRLILEALAIGLEPELRPKADESIALYVDRVASALGGQAAWSELWRFLDRVQLSQEFINASWVYNERRLTASLVAGLRYEGIGQMESAYQFYASVIKQVCRFNQAKGASDGIQRLTAQDPELPFRAKQQQEQLDAIRDMAKEAMQRSPGQLPPHLMEVNALEKWIESTAREVLAKELAPSMPEADPFVQENVRTASSPATATRFELSYLDDAENEVTAVFGEMTQDATPSLRLIQRPHLDLDQVQSIEILNTVPLEVLKNWPSRFASRSEVPRTKLKIHLRDGTLVEDEMYSTLYLSFRDATSKQRIKLHPCRILSVKRVPLQD